MPSSALSSWQNERARQLDELFDAHAALGGTGAGRRWRTTQLNRALVIAVASHFQGFAKELHTYAAITLGSLAQPTNPKVATGLAAGLQVGRLLDRQNANEAALRSDFSRFGIQLWPAMERYDRRTADRREKMQWFNRARNAIVHDDAMSLREVEAAGFPITLATIRRWRSALSGLADTIDGAVAEHLADLFGVSRPW